MILLTPRQHRVFTVLWTLTDLGERKWVGNLHRHLPGLTDDHVKSDLKRLGRLNAVEWFVVGCRREFRMLVKLEHVAIKPELPNKLQSAPPVGKSPCQSWKAGKIGRPAGLSNTHDPGSDILPDTGAFSRAFEMAFPDRDYRGLKTVGE